VASAPAQQDEVPRRFITFEGPEGAGKTTQIRRLAEALAALGETVQVTREPGGVPLAEALRRVLLHTPTLSRAAEALLFLAARAAHVEEGIRPALEEGKIVLCDRFHHSTLAYQGYGLGLEVEELRRLCAFAAGGLQPGLVLLLDLPVADGLLRRRTGQLSLSLDASGAPARPEAVNRIDNRAVEFHERVRRGFLAEAERDPERFRVIDARRSASEVHQQIARVVAAHLQLEAVAAR